ncbi:MAG TPA: hypothetical protein VMU87_02675 [Stellaceae bacterium]|nr:hypothetical protein [Stellaceae bacterium]
MALLIPTWLDLAGWAGVLAAAAALMGWGRLLTAGRAAPEAALVAGWGAAALILTLWGAATPASLRFPGAAILAAGIIALAAPRTRLSRAAWHSLARIAVVALPLLALMASARPSEPDTFLNLLPNAAYLYDHASFPADARPPAHSYLPAAPYNLQLAAFLASLLTPDFPANALVVFNIVLQLAAGLLLARLAAGAEDDDAAPSWGMSALGLLLATALNPGFVPRTDLAGYSEPAVAVAVAFAGWSAVELLERVNARRAPGSTLVLLALALAALVNVKQDSIALIVAVLVSAAGLARAGANAGRGLRALALASLPAVALYLVWRWYVLTHITAGELAPLPLALWQPGAILLILWNMAKIVGEKIFFYAVLAATLAIGVRRLRRHGLDRATRAAAMLGGSFALYSAALVFAYMALFPGTMGTDAHSYFRYSTHLSLLLMVAVVLLARVEARERGWAATPSIRRFAPAVAVATMLIAPIAFERFLRFDLEPPALRVWMLAREAAPFLAAGARVALLLPGDNGSVAPMLETVLRAVPPRHPDLDLAVVSQLAPDTLAALAARGDRLALLSCAPAGFALVPAGHAALLRRDASGWHAAAIWRYAPPPPGTRWSHVLATAPLCLG